MLDTVKLRGELEIKVYSATTRALLQHFVAHNLLVNDFMEVFGQLFALGQGAYKIELLKVGTDDTPPTLAQTNLIDPVFSKSCNTVTYSTTTKEVTATTTLESTEANGNVLREAGLFANSTSPVMLARRVFPDISKTADLTIDFVWRIKVILS